ncbi:MAG: hypothetical protein IKL85_03890 [Lentisphaeria bacterium]|nr:hypothetical protein [Lentisphaeria bacterium]
MNNRLYTVLIFIVSALMLAAAAIALRSGSRLQPSGDEPDEPIVEEEGFRAKPGDAAADTLMKVGEINWYYILYVFGSISIILGIINLWMYRHELLDLFITSDDEDEI